MGWVPEVQEIADFLGDRAVTQVKDSPLLYRRSQSVREIVGRVVIEVEKGSFSNRPSFVADILDDVRNDATGQIFTDGTDLGFRGAEVFPSCPGVVFAISVSSRTTASADTSKARVRTLATRGNSFGSSPAEGVP